MAYWSHIESGPASKIWMSIISYRWQVPLWSCSDFRRWRGTSKYGERSNDISTARSSTSTNWSEHFSLRILAARWYESHLRTGLWYVRGTFKIQILYQFGIGIIEVRGYSVHYQYNSNSLNSLIISKFIIVSRIKRPKSTISTILWKHLVKNKCHQSQSCLIYGAYFV